MFRSACYDVAITKLLEQALRQVEQRPEGEQNAAAGALLDYVKHMHNMQLTDAQLAEMRRRRADPNRKLISHAAAREHIVRHRAWICQLLAGPSSYFNPDVLNYSILSEWPHHAR